MDAAQNDDHKSEEGGKSTVDAKSAKNSVKNKGKDSNKNFDKGNQLFNIKPNSK